MTGQETGITFHDVNDLLSMEIDRTRRIERTVKIITAYRSGISIGALCEQYNVGKGNIYRCLRAAGIAVDRKRMAQAEAEERHAAILVDYRAGLPITTIAERYGCSLALVSRTASAAGVQRRVFKTRSVISGS